MNEHDQAVASAIAAHPNLGKIGDGIEHQLLILTVYAGQESNVLDARHIRMHPTRETQGP